MSETEQFIRGMAAPNAIVAEVCAALDLAPLEATKLVGEGNIPEQEIQLAREDHESGVRYRYGWLAGKLKSPERAQMLNVWRGLKRKTLLRLSERMERAWCLDASSRTDAMSRKHGQTTFMHACEMYNRRIINGIWFDRDCWACVMEGPDVRVREGKPLYKKTITGKSHRNATAVARNVASQMTIDQGLEPTSSLPF